jgi:hypothetical protein
MIYHFDFCSWGLSRAVNIADPAVRPSSPTAREIDTHVLYGKTNDRNIKRPKQPLVLHCISPLEVFNMRFDIVALFPLAASAVNIISSNDDGWAEANIRAFFESLQAADHSVVVSAPAENQSGKGMCYAFIYIPLFY